MRAVHNDHIKHISVCLVKYFIIGFQIFGISLGQDRPRGVEMLRVMRMRIMGIKSLDKVVLGLGDEDLILAEHGLELLAGEYGIKHVLASFPAAKIASVMNKAYIIAVQILPRPIDPGEFAVSGVLDRDVVSHIVLLIPEIKGISLSVLLALSAHMDRKIKRVTGHSVFFMCSYYDRSSQRFI